MLRNQNICQFVRAIEKSKFKKAEKLLTEDVENIFIQPLPVFKVTVLHLVTWKGNIDLVNALIAKGANVNDIDTFGRTALYYAAHCGHIDITKRLLECRANMNVQVKLPSSRDEKNKNIVQMFLPKSPFGRTAYIYSQDELSSSESSSDESSSSNSDERDYFSDDLNSSRSDEKEYYSPPNQVSWERCKHRAKNIVKAVIPQLSSSSDEDVENFDMYPIIHELPLPTCNGSTPLHEAVRNNHADVVRILVDSGARINIGDEHFPTPLFLAGTKVKRKKLKEVGKFFEIVRVLVSAGAYVDNNHWEIGTQVLFRATELGSAKTIELLLTKVCAKTLQAHYKTIGNTPFHIAAKAGDIMTLTALCNKIQLTHYDIDVRDQKNRTALHTAAFHGHRDCIKILINHGADLSATDKYSCIAADAIFTSIWEPVTLLIDIFDSSVVFITDNSLDDDEDKETEFEVDFKVLTPVHQKHQMAVIMAILHAADISQLTILQHPVVKTFLTLKWKIFKKFFLFLMLVHLSFICCFTIFALMFIEINIINSLMISRMLYVSFFCLLVQPLLQFLLVPKQYLKQEETWLMILCAIISLAPAIGSEFANCDEKESENRQCAQWILHYLCFAVVLSWMQTMLFIGRFPMWGYYALMFFAVVKNVLKVLVIFGFLIVGVALRFATVFHGNEDFGTFGKALISTVLMIMGEYEYTDVYKNNTSTDNKQSEHNSSITVRIIFCSFIIVIICTRIVLIKLMADLAVSDNQAFKKEDCLRQFVKQAEFIAQLERLMLHKIVYNVLIQLRLLTYLRSHIPRRIILSHGRYNSNISCSLIINLWLIAKRRKYMGRYDKM